MLDDYVSYDAHSKTIILSFFGVCLNALKSCYERYCNSFHYKNNLIYFIKFSTHTHIWCMYTCEC